MELYLLIGSFISVPVIIFLSCLWYLDGCSHSWKVTQQYEIKRTSTKEVIGYLHVKECEYCHKLKKEKITI